MYVHMCSLRSHFLSENRVTFPSLLRSYLLQSVISQCNLRLTFKRRYSTRVEHQHHSISEREKRATSSSSSSTPLQFLSEQLNMSSSMYRRCNEASLMISFCQFLSRTALDSQHLRSWVLED